VESGLEMETGHLQGKTSDDPQAEATAPDFVQEMSLGRVQNPCQVQCRDSYLEIIVGF